MSHESGATSVDLVRWTFSVNPAHRAEIESHLVDLGLDVLVYDESKFIVTWEEPDREIESVIEEIWDLNGEPFEVTQEDFHRLGLHTLQHEEPGVQEAA